MQVIEEYVMFHCSMADITTLADRLCISEQHLRRFLRGTEGSFIFLPTMQRQSGIFAGGMPSGTIFLILTMPKRIFRSIFSPREMRKIL